MVENVFSTFYKNEKEGVFMNQNSWVTLGQAKKMLDMIEQHNFNDFLNLYLSSLPNNVPPLPDAMDILGSETTEEEKVNIAQKLMITVINGGKS